MPWRIRNRKHYHYAVFKQDEDENDKKGERLAKKYGLHHEYREARRRGMNPYEAMDDWALPQEELNDMD